MALNLSTEVITFIMFASVIVPIILGLPIAFALAGVSMFLGLVFAGPGIIDTYRIAVFNMNVTYGFLAIPLFIFMGNMVEKTGITKRMYNALYAWMGGLKGGLAIITIIIGTILAACVGIIAASIVMLGLIAIPEMLEKKYDKKLITGCICAGGSLGILIPPSIMIVMYGPAASLSVGKLLMAAIMPGLLLSGLYIAYIYIRCLLNPQLGPAATAQEKTLSLGEKLRLLVTSLIPPILLIFSVLGSIMLGIASPTEASALGALASFFLAAYYKSLTLKRIQEALLATLRTTSMAMGVAYGAKMFTTLFLQLGCGNVISNLVIGLPGGRWVGFFAIMLVFFILGMFIDWLGILFIMVPIITPLGYQMGFDPIWFAMMMMINLQFSFITPPFAYSIFFLKGILQPEWGIETRDIIGGIIPYLGLILIAILLCILFPEIILWLPGKIL